MVSNDLVVYLNFLLNAFEAALLRVQNTIPLWLLWYLSDSYLYN